MKKITTLIAVLAVAILFAGCGKDVPQGTKGRVKTSSGWAKETLAPGRHTCWGRDKMCLVQSTQETYTEELKILVGGKINLTLNVQIRCALNPDKDIQLSVFEDILAKKKEGFSDPVISTEDLYNTFLQMKIQSIPREIIGSKPDILTVVSNRTEIGSMVRQRIMEESKATPLQVLAVEITNYDWPETITKAQEKLAEIQLEEQQEQAKIRAALAKSEGDLQIAEKDKLVEMKKAEGVAESIQIIRDSLKGSPEYLRWHEIRMLSEAAQGPNNAFIIVPYGQEVGQIAENAQLKQMLESKLTTAEKSQK